MFKDALARRRCLVSADASYEWKVIEGGKQPYAIAREDGQPIAFAGLWESFRWPDQTVTRSFTILTTTPNVEMADLHNRMPVILEERDWPMWLGKIEGDRVALDGLLRVWPVDRRVG
jgi:putative SOS response-associated peptidase YedK